MLLRWFFWIDLMAVRFFVFLMEQFKRYPHKDVDAPSPSGEPHSPPPPTTQNSVSVFVSVNYFNTPAWGWFLLIKGGHAYDFGIVNWTKIQWISPFPFFLFFFFWESISICFDVTKIRVRLLEYDVLIIARHHLHFLRRARFLKIKKKRKEKRGK